MKILEMETDSLIPYEKNPRKISGKAIEKVAESIEKYGFNQPVVVNQDNVICVGHTRWNAAKKLGLRTVPVLQKTMTEEQFKKYNIADNKVAEFSQWDYDLLSEQILNMKMENIEIKEIGFENFELENILKYSELQEDYEQNSDEEKNHPNEPDKEWEGMPEPENQLVKPFKTLLVYFENKQDLDEFSKKIGVALTEKTKYTWYPEKEKKSHLDKEWISE